MPHTGELNPADDLVQVERVGTGLDRAVDRLRERRGGI
jgi:hypothetical protein